MFTYHGLEKMTMKDKVITRKEAAAILGVSVSTFRRLETDKTLPMPKAFKVSRQHIGYALSDVQAVFQSRIGSGHVAD